MAEPAVLIVGLGNEMRGDDAAGVEVARRLREQALPAGVAVHAEHGEPVGLIDRWEGCAAVVIADAVRSGAPPGSVVRLDAGREPLPERLRDSTSTHAVSLHGAIELARTLGRLPAHVVVYGVEGGAWEAGAGLSDAVRAAVPALAGAVLEEARALAAAAGGR